MRRVTILHTNDFHNHLTEEQAARLKSLKSDLGDGGLLLDSGDAISAGNVTYKPNGEPILELMSDIGYDAMTVGNREFHLTRAGFFAKLSLARFPVLCANVAFTSGPGGRALPVQPCISLTLHEDIRVAVFGLTVPMITRKMLVRKVSAFVFDDPVETASRLVPQLRASCDLLVCLSHIGLQRDRELAERVEGIDLIAGGHTHAVLPEGERRGECLIVQAGWWGRYYGVVEAEIGEGKPRLTAKLQVL